MERTIKELKEIAKNKDLERYKKWISDDFERLKDFQKDKYILDFDIMCKEQDGYFKTPHEEFEYNIKLLMNYSFKYQVNFAKCFNTLGKFKYSL